METLRYSLIDVFTSKPFGGNQLAVFEESAALSTKLMQQLARELNLSETVFIQPSKNPKNEKSLRIFTPQMELPMAGHPTIGAAFVLASEGGIQTAEGQNEWILEEKVGEIPVTVFKEAGHVLKIEMSQPLPLFGATYSNRKSAAALLSLTEAELSDGLPVQTVSTGVPFLFIPVKSLEAIRKVRFRTDVWEKEFSSNSDTLHIFVFTTETEDGQASVHSRMFAPAMGIPEDAATGAASGPLGAYLVEYGLVPPAAEDTYYIRSEQGIEMGRPSMIEITVVKNGNDWKKIKIGGSAVLIGKGEIYTEELS